MGRPFFWLAVARASSCLLLIARGAVDARCRDDTMDLSALSAAERWNLLLTLSRINRGFVIRAGRDLESNGISTTSLAMHFVDLGIPTR